MKKLILILGVIVLPIFGFAQKSLNGSGVIEIKKENCVPTYVKDPDNKIGAFLVDPNKKNAFWYYLCTFSDEKGTHQIPVTSEASTDAIIAANENNARLFINPNGKGVGKALLVNTLPSRTPQDVVNATVRLIPNSKDFIASIKPNDPRYSKKLSNGSAAIFACQANDHGSFTAFALTAGHVVDNVDDDWVDMGGIYNLVVGNAEKKNLISSGIKVITRKGGEFKSRYPDDASHQDRAIISFDVATCPISVIAIKKNLRPNEAVMQTGFPSSEVKRTLVQDTKCSVVSIGGPLPCNINGVSRAGFSGGPITDANGGLCGIVSAGDGSTMILSDDLDSIRAFVQSACNAGTIPSYYDTTGERIGCPKYRQS